MTSVILEAGCFPSPPQLLLLRAALLKDEAAIMAWREWQTHMDFDSLDWGSYRLMPLVYRSLKSQGIEDGTMGRLRGIHRRTWYKSNLILGEATALVRDFRAAGIPTLMLKGIVLALLYYRDLGLRPMLDFDVLVPFKYKARALEQTRSRNWKEKFYAPHACGFNTLQDNEFDLHWHAFAECCQANADDELWSRAVPFQIGDEQTLTLDPTDTLLHVCVHGLAWNVIPPVRWVADAAMILRAADIDWTRLIAQARERHLALTASRALEYLAQTIDAAVPADVLRDLSATRVSRGERWDYIAKTIPPRERGPFLVSWAYLREYHRLVMNESIGTKIFSLPRFIQSLWGVKHVWQVPVYAIIGVFNRIRTGRWHNSKKHTRDGGETATISF